MREGGASIQLIIFDYVVSHQESGFCRLPLCKLKGRLPSSAWRGHLNICWMAFLGLIYLKPLGNAEWLCPSVLLCVGPVVAGVVGTTISRYCLGTLWTWHPEWKATVCMSIIYSIFQTWFFTVPPVPYLSPEGIFRKPIFILSTVFHLEDNIIISFRQSWSQTL